MQKTPMGFKCPTNMVGHLEKVFAGEYDLNVDFPPGKSIRILDLGANCGAFALWAARRWPVTEIFAYEPLPENYDYLTTNIKNLAPKSSSIHAFRSAVTGTYQSHTRIYLGKNNCGEASLFQCEGQTPNYLVVPTTPPSELPYANILKLDVEGAELEILHVLIGVEHREFNVIMLEYHSDAIRRAVDAILHEYVLVKAEIVTATRGTLCYAHRSAIRYV